MAAIGTYDPKSLMQTHLGPKLPIGIDRSIFPYSSGIAPSYVPSCLLSLGERGRQRLVEEITLQPVVDSQLLKSLEDDLQNHVEGRIQLLLQQMVLVYKTGLCFSLYTHADAQVGKGATGQIQNTSYVAAHSATLPTLRLKEAEFSDSSVSLGGNGSFFYGWNRTIYLPEIANQVDSEIDKTTCQGRCLREKSTNLLNQVSSSAISPEEALRIFLKDLTGILRALSEKTDSDQRKEILGAYLKAAERYQENLDNGYPLLQKICLRSIVEKVDEAFYLSVQEQMHETFRAEMQGAASERVVIPQIPADMDFAEILKEIGAKTSSPTGAVVKYTKLCSLDERVRAAARHYLLHLQKQERDLWDIPGRQLLKNLKAEILKTIQRETSTKSPQNLDQVANQVLLKEGQKIQLELPVVESAEKKQSLRSLIQNTVEKQNIQATPAAQKYVKTCKEALKVQDAAKAVFQELLATADPIKEQMLKALLSVKTSATIGKSNLSERAVTLVGAIFEEIQKKHGVAKPQKIPFILCQLLLQQAE